MAAVLLHVGYVSMDLLVEIGAVLLTPAETCSSKVRQRNHIMTGMLMSPLRFNASRKISMMPLICLLIFSMVPVGQAQVGHMPVYSRSSIFAYPGSSCPKGTEPYKGPERQEFAGTAVSFCVFKTEVSVVQKLKDRQKCGAGMKANAYPVVSG